MRDPEEDLTQSILEDYLHLRRKKSTLENRIEHLKTQKEKLEKDHPWLLSVQGQILTNRPSELRKRDLKRE